MIVTVRCHARAARVVRRIVGGGLLALQAVIAGSWIAEPVREVRLGAHADDYGVGHFGLHNEANCLACAARAMHAAPASATEVVRAPAIVTGTEPASAHTVRPQAVPDTRHSRAPPASA